MLYWSIYIHIYFVIEGKNVEIFGLLSIFSFQRVIFMIIALQYYILWFEEYEDDAISTVRDVDEM